jgi:putative oxidoreductase
MGVNMSNVLKIVGRVLLGLIIAVFGIFHLLNGAAMAGIVPKFMPIPVFWIYLTGAFHIFFAVMIIFKIKFSFWVALIMAALLVFYALAIHLVGLLGAASGAGMSDMINMLKDLGLAAGALYVASDLKKE